MPDPNGDQIRQISEKYTEFRDTLSVEQTKLLDALAELVWDSVADKDVMDLQFLAAFTPAQGAQLLAYARALDGMIRGHHS
jgi:hypothetical protein